MKLMQDDIEARLDYLEEVAGLGAKVDMITQLEDFATIELFKYEVQRKAVEAEGVSTGLLPAVAEATRAEIKRMENLFDSCFSQERIRPQALFDGCLNIRDKVARLTDLTEGQLVLIVDDLTVEFVVRKYAKAMLEGDIDDMHKILDQSLGKPLEQRVTEHRELSVVAGLTEAELRALLPAGESSVEMEIEIEDE
ncbi:MAG: hypothetical protein FWD27_00640 [Coriobacteriia bacterium]|nr:hypothetical protein [Coriobacteriia bacterium]